MSKYNKTPAAVASAALVFTATETFPTGPNDEGLAITVHTLSREFLQDGWRYTATSFKTIQDGFHAPKLTREFWECEQSADMIARYMESKHCDCTWIFKY